MGDGPDLAFQHSGEVAAARHPFMLLRHASPAGRGSRRGSTSQLVRGLIRWIREILVIVSFRLGRRTDAPNQDVNQQNWLSRLQIAQMDRTARQASRWLRPAGLDLGNLRFLRPGPLNRASQASRTLTLAPRPIPETVPTQTRPEPRPLAKFPNSPVYSQSSTRSPRLSPRAMHRYASDPT